METVKWEKLSHDYYEEFQNSNIILFTIYRTIFLHFSNKNLQSFVLCYFKGHNISLSTLSSLVFIKLYFRDFRNLKKICKIKVLRKKVQWKLKTQNLETFIKSFI